MTDGGPATTERDEPAPLERSSAAALQRYAASMRRPRIVYFSIVGAVVVALAVVVGVAWSRGEVANTSLHTVATAPPSLGVDTPSATPQRAWSTTDRTAIGVPQWGGTVVVFSKHTVRGLNARTGAQTWSYSRSNRTVCTAAQAGGTTVAIYEVNGNCDEVTALHTDTGKRSWERTLDQDGQPLNGHPTYQVLPYTVMITSDSAIYAIEPSTGYNRWTYSRFGCTIRHAVLGASGALISQTCTTPHCGKVKMCGRGPQLLLRDGSAAVDDKSTTNPDRITWNQLGDTGIPISADSIVSAYNPTTHALDVLDLPHGTRRATIALSPVPSSTDVVSATQAGTSEVIWFGGVAYAVGADQDTPLWTATTPGPPTIVSTTGEDNPSLPTARITVPTADGVRFLDGDNGRTAQSFSLAAPPAGSTVYPLGTGFVVAARSGTVAYR